MVDRVNLTGCMWGRISNRASNIQYFMIGKSAIKYLTVNKGNCKERIHFYMLFIHEKSRVAKTI